MAENGFHRYTSAVPDFTDGLCNISHANLLKASETKTLEFSKLLIADMRVQPGERSLCNCHVFYTLSPNICYRSLSETGYFVTDFSLTQDDSFYVLINSINPTSPT